jgi:hypothetical protein
MLLPSSEASEIQASVTSNKLRICILNNIFSDFLQLNSYHKGNLYVGRLLS